MHSSPRLSRSNACARYLIALGLVLSTEPALAGEPPAAAEQAKARFEAGKVAYRSRRYAEAVQCFLDADALAPRAPLSFDIARAYEQLGDVASAARYYRDYLERDPNAANAPLVRARIAALETPPPEPPVARGAPLAVTEPLEPRSAAADAREPRPAHPSFAPWSWLALGTGGAALVGAGVAELVRRDAEHDARTAPDQIAYADQYDRMRSSQTAARVLLVTGGVLAVTGSALVAIDLGRGRRAETRLACGPGACVGTFGGSF
ncbi:MAG TPA: hypothetical protein VLJ38_04750 [Polyangiaceae bacterium]|nr:hypothetical protein [Polyangiaceae bacterium]